MVKGCALVQVAMIREKKVIAATWDMLMEDLEIRILDFEIQTLQESMWILCVYAKTQHILDYAFISDVNGRAYSMKW